LQERLELIQIKVRKTGIPFYYCNLVGAQDELVFDGQSLAINSQGNIIGYGPRFEERIIYLETEYSDEVELPEEDREGEMYSALVLGVKDYFKKTGHKEAVIGLSGGIDSSLVACIAADALGKENVHGVSMPSVFSSGHSKTDAQQLGETLGIDYRTIAIPDIVDEYEKRSIHNLQGKIEM